VFLLFPVAPRTAQHVRKPIKDASHWGRESEALRRSLITGDDGLGSGFAVSQRVTRPESWMVRCWLYGMETTVLPREAIPLQAAKRSAEGPQAPGLSIFADGSWTDSGVVGYAVTCKRGLQWKGHRVHMGAQQEAYAAECAAIARALEIAALRPLAHERITIYTDAQAAIRRMGSDEPGPGQKYALEARKHIATIRRRRSGVTIELRWCPVHKGVPGDENADEWAKMAADEPDTHGVEHLRPGQYGDQPGQRQQPDHWHT
jgi:ribonuclease HI